MSTTTQTENLALREGSVIGREANTVLISVIAGIVTYICISWTVPQFGAAGLHETLRKFVGISWPFFTIVTFFLYYVAGAWTVEVFAFGITRSWDRISQILYWATEACPVVGLIATFLSLLMALLVYGEAGPGQPETQAAFITQFAIAFGSSVAGGILSLFAFTLHRLMPDSMREGT